MRRATFVYITFCAVLMPACDRVDTDKVQKSGRPVVRLSDEDEIASFDVDLPSSSSPDAAAPTKPTTPSDPPNPPTNGDSSSPTPIPEIDDAEREILSSYRRHLDQKRSCGDDLTQRRAMYGSRRAHLKALGPTHPEAIRAQKQEGMYFEDKFRSPKLAAESYEKVLKLEEEHLGSDSSEAGWTRMHIALMYQVSQRVPEAVPHLKRAREIFEKDIDRNIEHLLRALKTQTQIYGAMGMWDEAFEAAERNFRLRHQYFDRRIDSLEVTILDDIADVSDHSISFSLALHQGHLPERAEQIAQWVINFNVLGRRVYQRRLEEMLYPPDPGSYQLVNHWKSLQTQLSTSELDADTSGSLGQKLAVYGQGSHSVGELREISKMLVQSWGEERTSREWIDIAKLRQEMPKDTVLYMLVQFKYFNFAVRPQGQWKKENQVIGLLIPSADQGDVKCVSIGGSNALSQSVHAVERHMRLVPFYRGSEKDTVESLRPLMDRLSKLLITPILPDLEGAKRLVIAPVSSTWRVPFAALPIDEETCLIEKLDVAYLDTIEQLTTEPTFSPRSPPAIFGDVPLIVKPWMVSS